MRGLVGLLTIVLFAAVAAGQPAVAHAGPKQKLGLLSVEAQDGGDARSAAKTAALAKAMTESLRTRAVDTGLYELPAAAQKDLVELKLLSDCLDEKPECMGSLGRDLDVELLVFGHVQKKRDGYTLSLVAVNVATRKAVGSKNKVLSSAQATEDEVRKQAAQLFHDTLGIPMETQLIVSSNADGATVSIGGTAKGTVSGGQVLVRGVPEGKVLVAVEGAGWTRAERQAELKAGVTTRLELNTEKAQIAEPKRPPDVKPPFTPAVPVEDKVSRPGGTYRALFWTSLVLTGAGVTAFTITGLKVSSAEKDQDAAIAEWGDGYLANGLQHPNDACAEAANDGFQKLVDICDRGKSAATLSNVFLGVTAVGVIATGFFLWKGYLSAPKNGKKDTGVTFLPEIYPKGAGLGATIQF